MNIADILLNTDFFYSVLRVATPILFAALAALVSNRAGMMNVGIEGTMAFSALTGALVSAFTQSVLLGFLGAIGVGILCSLLVGFMSIKLKSHLFLTGIALNLLATGGTVFILYLVTGDKGTSSALNSLVIPNINIPLIENIPVVGAVLSNQNLMTYVGFLMVIVLTFFFNKTKLGLRIRAVGENETAVATVGVNVNRTKFIALSISGALAGMGGAFMSMGYVSFFAANMIAGRGFIGMAAEAIGRSIPFGTMLASLVFGVFDALANSLQMSNIPLQFVQMIPYVVTVVLFAIYAAQLKAKAERMKASE